MPEQDNLLEVQGLTKRFGPILAVDDVSFAVSSGEVLGFLGPNGAGKSTTMRLITGFLPPTDGTAVVCGFDVTRQPIEARRRIGYLPEGAPAYGDMTPDRLLGFVADIRDLKGDGRRRRLTDVIERLELDSVLHRPIETLSKGFKRRVGLAQAILLDPAVLILDEPTDGLDPNQKHQVRELLIEMAGEKAVVISTHILEEVEAVCTRAVVISDGRLVADSKPAELQARSRYHKAVGLRVAETDTRTATDCLERLACVNKVEVRAGVPGIAELLAVPADGGDILAPVREAVVASGVTVQEIYVERGRLDDVFRDLTVGG